MGLTPSPEKLWNHFRLPEMARQDSYLNSPAYYILTGRRDAWAYAGYGSALVACQHPHLTNSILMFPEIGPTRGKLAAHTLSDLDRRGKSIQLARYTPDDIAALRGELAAIQYTPVTGIDIIDEPYLDWKYPAHVLSTEKVTQMDGAKFQKVRGKYRHVEQDMQILSIDQPLALRAMRAALKFWEGNMVFSQKNEIEDLHSFYEILLIMLREWPGELDGLVFIHKRRPSGFTIWDRPIRGRSNLLANLSDITITGLSEYQIVESCRHMARKGIGQLNFGGSETRQLDKFKRKFDPVESFSLLSAQITFRPGKPNDVAVFPLIPQAVQQSGYAG